MNYGDLRTLPHAEQYASTNIEVIRKAYHEGDLKGRVIANQIYIVLTSLKEWVQNNPDRPKDLSLTSRQNIPDQSKLKQTSPQQGSNSLQQSANDMRLKGDPDKDKIMHEIFDPQGVDHQIPDYSKYTRHSEESFKQAYDDYDDDDGGRYE